MPITPHQLSGQLLWLLVLGCPVAAVGCASPSPPAAEEVGSSTDTPLPPLHPAIDHLDETVVTVRTPDGEDVAVDAKVADTDEHRRRGLMEVTDLPGGTGMLFLFDQERDGGFWMWNTLIELDIAFAADDGTIHTVTTMVPCEAEEPDRCPTTAPDAPYTAALEVPGGWFDEVGVTPGATMTWTDPEPIRP